MRVALAQMKSLACDKDRNVGRAKELIADAARQGSDIILLPEFFNTEYFAQYRDNRYIDYAEPLDGPSLRAIAASAREHAVWVVATVLEKQRPGFCYDSAVLFDREGRIKGVSRKLHPAAVFSLEKLYFRYGSHFPVFDVEGWHTSIMICYDAFFPEVARIYALHGAELILAPFAAPEHPIWRELHIIRAFENGCFVASCNKVGVEGEWVFSGKSLIASPAGQILAEGSSENDDLVVGDLDRSLIEAWRRRYPMFRDRRPELYKSLCAPTEDL